MFSRARAILLVSLLTVSAVGSQASAALGFDTDQGSLRWTRKVVILSVSTSLFENPRISGGNVERALQSSAEAWSRVTGIRFVIRRIPADREARGLVSSDRLNSISALESPESLLMFSGEESANPAKTRIVARRSGEIVEADVHLNPFLTFSTDGAAGSYDLQSVLTHELGHVIGLEHSPVKGASMFDAITPNGHARGASFIPRTLASDDVVAAQSRYGSPVDARVGTISGRVRVRGAQPLLKVWLEERSTGRVVAGRFARQGGAFEFKSIPEGEYVLRVDSAEAGFGVQPDSETAETVVSLDAGQEVKVGMGLKIVERGMSPSLVSIDGDGINSAVGFGGMGIARIAVALAADFSAEARIETTSRLLDFVSSFSSVSEVGMKWVGGDLYLDGFLPAGEYTLVVVGPDGMRSYEVGAISVDPLSRVQDPSLRD